MPGNFKALLLDMNGTFMFGGDRFAEDEDFSIRFRELGGGSLAPDTVNSVIREVYDSLLSIYPEPAYRESFPKVRDTVSQASDKYGISETDLDLLTQTFAYHELGTVPAEYAEAVASLSRRFRLALVADVWSQKTPWLKVLSQCGLADIFEVMLFSSDTGIVKPSPRQFLKALRLMNLGSGDALVVGDSVRRDLGGAAAASLPCLLVGGASHPDSYGTASDIIELSERCALL